MTKDRRNGKMLVEKGKMKKEILGRISRDKFLWGVSEYGIMSNLQIHPEIGFDSTFNVNR